MLLEKSPSDMGRFIQELLPSLLNALTDSADDVVLMNLQARNAREELSLSIYLSISLAPCLAPSPVAGPRLRYIPGKVVRSRALDVYFGCCQKLRVGFVSFRRS